MVGKLRTLLALCFGLAALTLALFGWPGQQPTWAAPGQQPHLQTVPTRAPQPTPEPPQPTPEPP
ncbi:MAG: hypothetical protein ACE5H9_18055, partial [Anaerolineae bacterium]